MEIQEKIELLEDMMDLDDGDLEPSTCLEDLEEWDSMAKLSLVVLAKREFEKDLSADAVKGLKTVQDICDAL